MHCAALNRDVCRGHEVPQHHGSVGDLVVLILFARDAPPHRHALTRIVIQNDSAVQPHTTHEIEDKHGVRVTTRVQR
jgi:hypothetical protein